MSARQRCLIDPFRPLADVPLVRSAVQAPTVTAIVALLAIALAAVIALGVVTPLGQGRAAGGPPVATPPSGTAHPGGDPGNGEEVATDRPVDVLAETVTAAVPESMAPVTSVPDAPDLTPTVAVVGPLPDALPAPTGAPIVCTPDGEPAAGAVVDALGCRVVAPVEGLLAGLLDEGAMAEIVGDLSLLP